MYSPTLQYYNIQYYNLHNMGKTTTVKMVPSIIKVEPVKEESVKEESVKGLYKSPKRDMICSQCGQQYHWCSCDLKEKDEE